jgi:hypothetical protein
MSRLIFFSAAAAAARDGRGDMMRERERERERRRGKQVTARRRRPTTNKMIEISENEGSRVDVSTAGTEVSFSF